jgi:hypothetical protein
LGERYKAASGTYHGALYGSTLLAHGPHFIGMQVYDNRRNRLLAHRRSERQFGITATAATEHMRRVDDRIRRRAGLFRRQLPGVFACRVLCLRSTASSDVHRGGDV